MEQRPPTVQVMVDRDALVITLAAHLPHAANRTTTWAEKVPALPPGPFKRLILDLGQVPAADSSFFAGALQLLERLRNRDLAWVTLRNAPASVVETISIMNLGHLFRVEGTRPVGNGTLRR